MFLTLLALLALVATPVATPVAIDSSPEWAVPIGVEASVEPMVTNGLAIVAASNNTMYAFDIDSGETMWTAVMTDAVSAPMVEHGDTLLVPGSQGTLTFIKIETGDVLDMQVLGSNKLLEPVVSGTSIIVADDLGTVSILDEDTHAIRANLVIPGGVSRMVVLDSLVVIAGQDATIHAFDIESADVAWQTVASGGIGALEVTDSGDIFLAVSTGDVMMLSAEDGRTVWHEIPTTNGLLDVAFADDTILGISSGGDVIAINPEDGSILWQDVVPSHGWIASDRCDTSCYLVQADGTVSMLTLEEGKVANGNFVTQEVAVPPIATDRELVIVTRPGDVLLWELGQD